MKIQGDDQVVGVRVLDGRGRRLGRIVAVACAADDPYEAQWFLLRLRFLLRLTGWRRPVRAVPADAATWHSSGAITVPRDRIEILASPSVTRGRHVAGFVPPGTEHHYYATTAP